MPSSLTRSKTVKLQLLITGYENEKKLLDFLNEDNDKIIGVLKADVQECRIYVENFGPAINNEEGIYLSFESAWGGNPDGACALSSHKLLTNTLVKYRRSVDGDNQEWIFKNGENVMSKVKSEASLVPTEQEVNTVKSLLEKIDKLVQDGEPLQRKIEENDLYLDGTFAEAALFEQHVEEYDVFQSTVKEWKEGKVATVGDIDMLGLSGMDDECEYDEEDDDEVDLNFFSDWAEKFVGFFNEGVISMMTVLKLSELTSPDECISLVKKIAADLRIGVDLNYIPENHRTPEMCLAFVQNEGSNLSLVPEEQRTPEMCLAAVKSSGMALRYVPKSCLSDELCLLAANASEIELDTIPEEFRSAELCLIAVTNNGYNLKHVPEKDRTPELCLAAVNDKGISLMHVPEQHRTPELCLVAVNDQGSVLDDVPEQYRTPEICLAAVKSMWRAIQYVPTKHMTLEICLEAIKRYGGAFEYVPEEFKTAEVCLIAVTKDESMLEFVPEEHVEKIKAKLNLE